MGAVIWIEVLSRHRSVLSRHRCEGQSIAIGRAYSNDVVLDDPHVAPAHVRIERGEDGHMTVLDLGSANGLFAAHGGGRVNRLALDDDTVFRIGHSLLRVRTAEHAVASERPFGRRDRVWLPIAALAILVPACEAVSQWLTDYSEPRTVTYLIPLLLLLAVIGAWTIFWSTVTRVFAGHAGFERNLLIALAGALGFELLEAASAMGAFGLSLNALANYANYSYVGFFCLFAVIAYFQLRQINPVHSLASAGIVAVLFLAAVGVEAIIQSDGRPGPSRSTVRHLLPPSLRLAPVEGEAAFFDSVKKLQGKLDRDRTEEP
jgi:hypothetical protein